MPKSKSDTDRRLDALYAKMPDIECKKLCADACGVLKMSERERQRITERGIKISRHDDAMEQYLTTGEYTCEALNGFGLCSVYEIRPLICRLWGLVRDVPSLRCEHGCIPERWLRNDEALALVEESIRIGGTAD